MGALAVRRTFSLSETDLLRCDVERTERQAADLLRLFRCLRLIVVENVEKHRRE